MFFSQHTFFTSCLLRFIFLGMRYSPHYLGRYWWSDHPGRTRCIRSPKDIRESSRGNRSRPRDWLRGRGTAPPSSWWTNHLASLWSEMKTICPAVFDMPTQMFQPLFFLTNFGLKYLQKFLMCVLPPCYSPDRGFLGLWGGGARDWEAP